MAAQTYVPCLSCFSPCFFFKRSCRLPSHGICNDVFLIEATGKLECCSRCAQETHRRGGGGWGSPWYGQRGRQREDVKQWWPGTARHPGQLDGGVWLIWEGPQPWTAALAAPDLSPARLESLHIYAWSGSSSSASISYTAHGQHENGSLASS